MCGFSGWQDNYVGSLVGLVDKWFSWLLGPALCEDCQWLVVNTRSQNTRLQNAKDPRAGDGLLVGRD